MADLLAAWSFDEASGAAINHAGNPAYNITLSGNTIRTAPGNGAFGRGLTQLASEVFTAFPLPAELQPAQRSWMCNVKITASNLGWVGEFYRQDNDTGVWGFLNLNGSVQFRAKDSSNVERHVNLGSFATFKNLAATYDGTTLRVYTDGVLTGEIAAPPIWAATHFRLLDGTNSVTTIDDMRLFSGALTAEEINAWRVLPADQMPAQGGRLKYESAPGVWTPVPLKLATGEPLIVKSETSPGTWEALP